MPRPPVFTPMLATSGRPSKATAGWIVEPKLDGCRNLISVHDGRVTIRSRNGLDVTDCYPEIVAPAGLSAVFDGEIVAMNERGLPDFQRLQSRMNRRRPSAALVSDVPVSFHVFDVLWRDGDDLTARPLHERRDLLETVPLTPPWYVVPRLDLTVDDTLVADLVSAGSKASC